MGRCHECDVKISDISVSRNHAQIHYKDNKFWLQDTSSKFGTLTLARGRIQVLPGTTLGMQVGRTLLLFVIFNDRQNENKRLGVYMHLQEKINKKKIGEEKKER